MSETLTSQTLSSSSSPQSQTPVFALVGNPNCGKTTLFNALTGSRQKVANYPGVTVERKIGTFLTQHGKPLPIIDLPGAYSFAANSPDEAILRNVLVGHVEDEPKPNQLLCIADAISLERHLYLCIQAAELGLPMTLAINREDLAQESGIDIDTAILQETLGISVILTQANKGTGLIPLRLALSRAKNNVPNQLVRYSNPIEDTIERLEQSLIVHDTTEAQRTRGIALLLLQEGNCPVFVSEKTRTILEREKARLNALDPNWPSALIQARYEIIQALCRQAITHKPVSGKTLTEKLDSVFLHPILGWVSLATIMGGLFWSIFSLAGYPIDAINWTFNELISSINGVFPRGPLRDLLNDGILTGISNILMFLPQILILFFFIGILESTGYLPRAAFLLDRVMGRVGLQGKSFIPLLSSFACAVPGIMATRTLKSPKERLATILIAPWMSCSARLPVYLLLIAACLPNHSAWVKAGVLLFAYTFGMVAAFSVAWISRKTLLKGESTDVIMELPPYTWPSWRNLVIYLADRARTFIKRVGTTILTLSIIMWFLTAYPQNPDLSGAERLEHSYAGIMGQYLEPVISPLGYDWKVGIGLVSAFTAREVFVSTMAIVYSVENGGGGAGCCCGCGGAPKNTALASILPTQTRADGSTLFTPLTCISLMVFFIFALQCISTIAIVRQETGSWRWPIFQLIFMTSFAYIAALCIYQGGKLLGFA
tara:strand:- start:61672 stop:63816 length:2145 start_codon:yes stop_codon:yes gene_type:complete